MARSSSTNPMMPNSPSVSTYRECASRAKGTPGTLLRAHQYSNAPGPMPTGAVALASRADSQYMRWLVLTLWRRSEPSGPHRFVSLRPPIRNLAGKTGYEPNDHVRGTDSKRRESARSDLSAVVPIRIAR